MNSYCANINHVLLPPFQFRSHHHLPANTQAQDNLYHANFLPAFSLSEEKQLILIFWLVLSRHHLLQRTHSLTDFLVANNRPSRLIYTSTIVFFVLIYKTVICRKASFCTYSTGSYRSKIFIQITIKSLSFL